MFNFSLISGLPQHNHLAQKTLDDHSYLTNSHECNVKIIIGNSLLCFMTEGLQLHLCKLYSVSF